MYNLYASELKSKFRYQLVNMAVTCWKHSKLSNDEISDKISEIERRVDRCSKMEFISMFNSYSRKVESLL